MLINVLTPAWRDIYSNLNTLKCKIAFCDRVFTGLSFSRFVSMSAADIDVFFQVVCWPVLLSHILFLFTGTIRPQGNSSAFSFSVAKSEAVAFWERAQVPVYNSQLALIPFHDPMMTLSELTLSMHEVMIGLSKSGVSEGWLLRFGVCTDLQEVTIYYLPIPGN